MALYRDTFGCHEMWREGDKSVTLSLLQVLEAPAEIPGGFLATYAVAGGVTIYVMDQSTDAG